MNDKLRFENQETSINPSNKLVFIDSSVKNKLTLLQNIPQKSQIILIGLEENGVEKIMLTLHEHHSRQRIHIIAQGYPGCLYLGNTQLSLDTLDRYGWDLQTWSVSQILLSGCNVTAGDAGSEFISKLQQLTGANIAVNFCEKSGEKQL